MDNRKYVAIKPTTLSVGVSVSDTTCIPSQIKDRLGNSITSMSTSFGTKGFGVISPNTEKEEQFVFTGLSGGTITGISAVTMQDPYTETSGFAKEHAAGEPILLYTNSPAFYNSFVNKENDETVNGVVTFTQSPVVPTGGTGTQAANATDIANAISGASGTATNLVNGTVKLSVAAASAPNPIVVGDNDPRVPTSGQTALLAAITASAAELNVLDGYTGTTADLNEMSAIVQATNITGAELEDLSDGGSTTIHTHNSLVPSFSHFVAVNTSDTSATSMDQVNAGFSDASTAIISAGVQIAGAVDDIYQLAIKVSDDIGLSTYADAYYRYDTSASPVTNGAIVIGTSVWQLTADATAGNRVRKDGGSVTISGTNPGAVGALGHDPTNSYLLALDSTTTIKRYSGIAGTTITFVDSITLDTAVSTVGFAYDADNQRYICLDKTANVLRRFNSTGTTIDTVAYTVDDTNVLGVCIIGNRVYLIAVNRQTITGGTTGFGANISLVPTNMTR